jgi:hypothetical protein
LYRSLHHSGWSGAHLPFSLRYEGHGPVGVLTGPTGAFTDTYDFDAFGNLTLIRFVKFG